RRSARAPHAERRAGPGAGMNFQAVLAGLPDAVIAVDEALRVVFWNAAAEELTERSARRMEGRMLKEVFAPDASLVRRLSETLAMGLSRSETETSVERPDHRVIPVSIVTAPLFDRAGRVEAAVAVVRDLSRIRQLEAEVRRGETLAAAGRMAVGLAHEDRLVQVFHNLVRNAIEAMGDGGQLTLATRVSMNPLFGKVDMGAGQRSMVEVQVLDEGSGIPAAARGRIFDPFFTTKERGLGLGLAICHQVMEQHHGAIQIDSIEGHGTTVTCFLPIAR